MPAASRLLVIEDMVCEPNIACRSKIGDIVMLVRTGGRNRTQAEYRSLLSRAGFEVNRTIPIQAELAILEASPAGKVQ